MKKQILTLISLFLLTMTMAFGQAGPGSAPRGVDCADDPEHPIAGKSYTYEASATPAGGNFTFWATKDQEFIETTSGTTTTNIATRLTTPTDLLATSANYATATTTNTVSITWSDGILAGTGTTAPKTPTFVAVHYDALDPNCADNFKVWSIIPMKAFTVDVRNINEADFAPLGYDIEDAQCLDIVRGATYSAGAMAYNYGTQVLYFEVVGANFTGYYTPNLTVGGLHAVQTYTIDYTYSNPSTWTTTPPTWTPYVNGTTTFTTNETTTNTGVSTYIRVTVQNNNYEGIANRDVSLTVDAVNSVNEWDIANNTLTDPGPNCDPGTLNDGMDQAVQVLTLRPTLSPTTPAAFVPGNNQN